MRRHDVDDHFQAQRVRPVHQPVKISQRSVVRVHIAIIRDIISEIPLRRREERADPDRINTETGNIVQP